jgi:calcineurin-like phosphoesterase family protein
MLHSPEPITFDQVTHFMAEKSKTKLPSHEAVILGHISDIHFRKRGKDNLYTVDDDLREELCRALGTIADELGGMHGLLITGDIAFAGTKEEYAKAYTWIKQVCARTKCPEEAVRTICGNHDVVRAAAKDSRFLQNAHAELRRQGREQAYDAIDEHIRALLADAAVPELLFTGLQNYNEFADKFFCGFNAAKPFWQQDILLNDRSTLRICGLNSTLVSNADDDLGQNKLVLGPGFAVLPRVEGVEYLVMCHHPPQWLWDQDRIEDYLNTRARIVLFGHKHIQRISKITTGDYEILRIHAGALNPDPGEGGYEPRFNCLRLWVAKNAEQRTLHVEIYRRVWKQDSTKFEADGGACQKFELKLSEWGDNEGVAQRLSLPASVSAEPTEIVSDPLSLVPEKAAVLHSPRRLAYRFMALPYHLRLEVAQKLNLLSDEDRGQSDLELFRRFFRRATERSQLAALWRETEKQHADGKPDENPFDPK